MPKRTRGFDKRLSIAKKMPPLPRRHASGPYSAESDRVLDWVKTQTDLLAYLVDLLDRNDCITYNSETGLWQGVDYED